MASTDRFKPYAPDVRAVVRLEEALPPEHPVHRFVDLVRSVDLGYFAIPPGPKGEKPYHPHALFGILAWGYLHGVRSSRKLARLARQDATFAYLSGGGRPDYRTLAQFRRDNAAAFTAIFQETVVLALRLGVARLGHVALDGTKLKANTSKHTALSYGRMKQREARLKDEITRLVEQAEARDATEDREYGVDSDGSSVAEELARREARLAKIRALREPLEAGQRTEQGLAEEAAPEIAENEQRSFADTDARIMLMKRGAYDYAYNAQAAVDAEHGVIFAADRTNVAPDVGHLPGLVARVRALRAVAEMPEEAPTTASDLVVAPRVGPSDGRPIIRGQRVACNRFTRLGATPRLWRRGAGRAGARRGAEAWRRQPVAGAARPRARGGDHGQNGAVRDVDTGAGERLGGEPGPGRGQAGRDRVAARPVEIIN